MGDRIERQDEQRVVLDIIGISKTYQSKEKSVNALKDISFSIKEGEIFGLLGINGAGKSTLSSILATLHPPTSGDILFKGRSIYKDLFEYRAALGYCPQHPNLDMQLSVYQNLWFAGKFYLLPNDVIKERIDQLLHDLGLEQYRLFKIQELSGGNKQKVLIARSLIHKPRIVILDEPTVGLDPDIRRKLWDLIKELKRNGITIILTTHYLDEAEHLSDRICVLHRGSLLLIEDLKTLKATRFGKTLKDIFIELMKEQEE